MAFTDAYSGLLSRTEEAEFDRWLTQMTGGLDEGKPGVERYRPMIERVAREYQLDPRLMVAMVQQESTGNPGAVSPKGAQGILQLMPATARRFGVQDPFDPEDNLRGGMRYMRYLQRLFPGRTDLQLAAYNAGEGAVKKYGNQIPPYRETQDYVQRILATYQTEQGYVSKAPGMETDLSPQQRQTAQGAVTSLTAPRLEANRPPGVPPSTLQPGRAVDVRPRIPMVEATEEQAAVFEGTYTPPTAIEGPPGVLEAQRQPVGRIYQPGDPGLEEPLLQRLPARMAQGALQAAAGALSALPAFEQLVGIATPFGNTAQDLAQTLRATAATFEPSGTEETIIDRLAATLGGQAVFFGAGIGAEVGRRALFTAAPKVATALGLGTPALVATVMEAATEAGDTYDALTPLVGPEEAASRANSVFWRNAVAIGLTNRLGVFNPAQASVIGKVVASGALEGVQEVVQYDIQRRQFTVPADHPQAEALAAQGWQRDEASGQLRLPFAVTTAAEAFVIGGLVGGAAGGLMQELATTLPEDPAQTAKLPEFRSWMSALQNERGAVAMPFGPEPVPPSQPELAPTIRRGAGLPTERLRDERGRWRIPLRDIPPTELELQDFVRQQGGIQLATETDVPGELRALIHPQETGTTGLLNNVRGLTLQHMAERASEYGFTPTADKVSFLEALDRSVRQSQGVYSQQAVGTVPFFDDPNVTMAYEAFLGIADTFQQRTTEQRRGVRPRAEVHAEAAALLEQGAWTRQDLEAIVPGTVLTDTQTSALIQQLNSLGQALQRAATAYLTSGDGPGSPKALALLQIAGLYGDLSPARLGVMAEAGRSLGILNDPLSGMNAFLRALDAEVQQAPERSLDTFARRIVAMADEATLSKNLLQQARRGSMFEEFFYNGLFSPRTVGIQFIDGAINTAWAIGDRMLAAVIGMRPGGAVTFHEVQGLWEGFFYGQYAALQAGYQMYRRLEETGLRQSAWDQTQDLQQKYGARDYRAVTAENLGLDPSRAWSRGFDAWARYVGFGSGGRLLTRMIITADEYVGMLNYGMEMRALARRATHDLPVEHQAAAIAAFLQQPPDAAVDAAQEAVRQRLYTNELGKFGQWIAQGSEQTIPVSLFGYEMEVPAGRVLLPFVRVASNIARTMVDRTPLAIGSQKFWTQLQEGGATADIALAKAASGTMLLTTFAALAAAGILTGRGPEDPELRAAGQWNEREYSVRFGDKYVSFRRLGSLGMLMGIAADIVQLIGEGELSTVEKLTAGALTVTARNIFSQTWMQGLERFFSALTLQPGETTTSMGSGALRFLQGLPAMAVPGMVASVERALDPEIREVDGLLDRAYSEIPGWSKDLPARRNRWGEKKLLGWGFDSAWVNALYNAVSPLEIRQVQLEPIEAELEKQQIQIGMPSRTLAVGADMTLPLEGQQFQRVRLTDQHYEAYVTLAAANDAAFRPLGLTYPPAEMDGLRQRLLLETGGRERPPAGFLALKEALNWFITTRAYADYPGGPDGGKAQAIARIVQAYTDAGQRVLLDHYPEMARSLDAARVERLRRTIPLSRQDQYAPALEQYERQQQAGRRQRTQPRLPVGGGR